MDVVDNILLFCGAQEKSDLSYLSAIIDNNTILICTHNRKFRNFNTIARIYSRDTRHQARIIRHIFDSYNYFTHIGHSVVNGKLAFPRGIFRLINACCDVEYNQKYRTLKYSRDIKSTNNFVTLDALCCIRLLQRYNYLLEVIDLIFALKSPIGEYFYLTNTTPINSKLI